MMRSLYSAVSGLRNHQTRMDVIGNNVANVNTTGFKRSIVNFNTVLSQTLRGASAPVTGSKGGTNAMQVGLGVSIGSISQIMTTGNTQTTGVSTHVKIDGEGMFMLSTTGTDIVYSRAGVFGVDKEGYLVDDATGAFVLGEDESPIQVDLAQYSNSSVRINIDGSVSATRLDNGEEEIQGYIGLAIFPNQNGLTNIGNNFYQVSNNSGTPTYYSADSTAYPFGTSLVSGSIEMSNVNLADEFTDMIVTQRGFQANSRVITVSDTLLEELINLKR